MDIAATGRVERVRRVSLIEGVGLTYGDEVVGDPCGRAGFGMEMPLIGAD